MSYALNAQTFGSLTFVGAFAAAEGAARYLAHDPASALAWYLNLSVFRAFELARTEHSPLHLLFGPTALSWALGGLVLGLFSRVLRFHLGVAALANVSFAGALALAAAWFFESGSLKLVPTRALAAPLPNSATVLVVLASAFLAFVASHLSFVMRVYREWRVLPSAPTGA